PRRSSDLTVDAFFPEVDVASAPGAQRRTGLTTLGLPYAQDPAVTRHLAAFLRRGSATLARRPGATFLHPTAILFNGGVFKDASLQERVASLVDRWVRAEGGAPIKLLRSASLDLAVALGASYSGLARRGRGIRIRGGTARAYYVGVEAATPAVPGFAPPVRAVCLAPFGMEAGSTVELTQREVGARVCRPVGERSAASRVRRPTARRRLAAAGSRAPALASVPPLAARRVGRDRGRDIRARARCPGARPARGIREKLALPSRGGPHRRHPALGRAAGRAAPLSSCRKRAHPPALARSLGSR